MLVRGTCLYDQVESGIFPHVVEVGQYLVVGDGQHHDEDPQQDHRHEELVDHPHGHHGRLEEVTPLPSGLDTGGQLATGHLVHGESHHELTLHFDKINDLFPYHCHVEVMIQLSALVSLPAEESMSAMQELRYMVSIRHLVMDLMWISSWFLVSFSRQWVSKGRSATVS